MPSASSAARGDDEHGSFAVIDLVAHLYRGTSDDRRALAAIWSTYTDATVKERTSKGFEMVRMHHATLTRIFRDDPDGDYLDIEDVRMVWEEFVDALRDATGAAHDAPVSPENAKSYDALEKPVMKRNQSFSRLAMDLAAAASVSPVASPEGSTRGIERISSSGMLLGIGCSSREPSLRGGNAFFSASSSTSAGVRAEDVARALAADGKNAHAHV